MITAAWGPRDAAANLWDASAWMLWNWAFDLGLGILGLPRCFRVKLGTLWFQGEQVQSSGIGGTRLRTVRFSCQQGRSRYFCPKPMSYVPSPKCCSRSTKCRFSCRNISRRTRAGQLDWKQGESEEGFQVLLALVELPMVLVVVVKVYRLMTSHDA